MATSIVTYKYDFGTLAAGGNELDKGLPPSIYKVQSGNTPTGTITKVEYPGSSYTYSDSYMGISVSDVVAYSNQSNSVFLSISADTTGTGTTQPYAQSVSMPSMTYDSSNGVYVIEGTKYCSSRMYMNSSFSKSASAPPTLYAKLTNRNIVSVKVVAYVTYKVTYSPSYTITWELGPGNKWSDGTTGNKTTTITPGSNATPPAVPYYDSGNTYTFNGWAAAPANGATVLGKDSIPAASITGDDFLYPQWSPKVSLSSVSGTVGTVQTATLTCLPAALAVTSYSSTLNKGTISNSNTSYFTTSITPNATSTTRNTYTISVTLSARCKNKTYTLTPTRAMSSGGSPVMPPVYFAAYPSTVTGSVTVNGKPGSTGIPTDDVHVVYGSPTTFIITASGNTSSIRQTSSSDTNFAKVTNDSNTVQVEIIGNPGNSCTISVRTIASSTYESAKSTFKVYYDRASISPSVSCSNLTYGGSTVTASVSGNSGSGTVTWASSDTNVATINSSGVVTPKAAGTTTITASIAQTANYLAGSASKSITVNKAAGKTGVATSDLAVIYGSSNTRSISGNTGTISVSSSNTAVATVSVSGSTITVTAKGNAGTSCTITVNAAAATNYNAASSTFKVTIGKANNPMTWGAIAEKSVDFAQTSARSTAACTRATGNQGSAAGNNSGKVVYIGGVRYTLKSVTAPAGSGFNTYFDGWSLAHASTSSSLIVSPSRSTTSVAGTPNAGKYTVTLEAYAPGNTNYKEITLTKSFTLTVNMLKSVLTLTASATTEYHGTATITAKCQYGTGTLYWGTAANAMNNTLAIDTTAKTVTSRTSIGTTTIYAYYVPIANTNAPSGYPSNWYCEDTSSNPQSTSIKIVQASDATMAITSTNGTYNRGNITIATCNAIEGVSKYQLGYSTTDNYSDVTWSSEYTVTGKTLSTINAGTYKLWYRFLPDANHSIGNHTAVTVSGATWGYKKIAATATINQKSLADSSITVTATTNFIYNGSPQSTSVTVKDGTTTLTLNTEYTLSGTSYTEAGTYTATATGKGNYTGSKSVNWVIKPGMFVMKNGAWKVVKEVWKMVNSAWVKQTVYGNLFTPHASGGRYKMITK